MGRYQEPARQPSGPVDGQGPRQRHEGRLFLALMAADDPDDTELRTLLQQAYEEWGGGGGTFGGGSLNAADRWQRPHMKAILALGYSSLLMKDEVLALRASSDKWSRWLTALTAVLVVLTVVLAYLTARLVWPGWHF